MSVSRALIGAVVLLVLPGCPEDTHDDDDDSSSGDDLPAGIHEVIGLDPDLPPDDLMPLTDIVGDAPMVALGESVHTSGGYYQAKHRLFRHLVEEVGFRAFAIESPWCDADGVAQYVEGGPGSGAEVVVEGLVAHFAGQTMLDMVEWMRAWNIDHPDDPVTYFGFDIQQPWCDGPGLTSFVEAVIPDLAEQLVPGLERCNGVLYGSADEYWSDPAAMHVEEEDHQACVAALDELQLYLDEQETELIDATSAEVVAQARIHLTGLCAWERHRDLWYSDSPAAYEARDQGMAEVLLQMWDLRVPGQRVAVWAHNWHITGNTELQTDNAVSGASAMGGFLDIELGDDYLPVGLLGYQVSVNWPETPADPLDIPIDPDNLAVMLHDLGREYLLVDLAFPGAADPFLEPGGVYQIGTSGGGLETLVPADHYRALFFLDESPGMDAL